MKDFDENDKFWSLDSMLPQKKSKAPTNSVKKPNDVSAVEIEIAEKPPLSGKYPPIKGAKHGEPLNFSEWLKARDKFRSDENSSMRRVILSYKPSSPLIKSVEVSVQKGVMPVTERFVADGKRLIMQECEFKGNVPCDSVYPQYATLSDSQLACYIGFRTAARNGSFFAVDKAYIYLYLYELINIKEPFTPTQRAEQMAALLCGMPSLDDKTFSDVCNWLADTCLVYGIEAPRCVFGDIHPRILRLARLREFFVKPESLEADLFELTVYGGGYDYRTSKLYKENKQYYDKYIPLAVSHTLKEMSKKDNRLTVSEDDLCTVTRDSFFGAYRTVGARYVIKLECIRITRTEDEKRIVSDVVKYTENCLRARLGIKQRLTVGYLHLEQKAIIKDYVSSVARDVIPPKRTVAGAIQTPDVPEYEKLYEPKSEGFSIENAALIEQRSWGVTEKLVTAFEDVDGELSEVTGAIEEQTDTAEVKQDTSESSDEVLYAGVRLLLSGDNVGFNAHALKSGTLPDALADAINSALYEKIGDIAVEREEDGYRIAEWYIDDVREIVG